MICRQGSVLPLESRINFAGKGLKKNLNSVCCLWRILVSPRIPRLNSLALLLLASAAPFAHAADPVINVDLSVRRAELRPFWASTGFSPADIIATPEMQAVAEDDARLPRRGLQFIRPHYLLNLAVVRGMDTERPEYDWSRLYRSLDLLVRSRFKLIFELMGFPSDGGGQDQYDKNFQEQIGRSHGYFDDLRAPGRMARWRVFIAALARHLEERYGSEEVRSWLFETTNEPNLPHFWRYNADVFLAYYDASSDGLADADSALKFGGPGSAPPELSEAFTRLIAHCAMEGRRLDFISVHIKDQPQAMVARELSVIGWVRSHYPSLGDKPFLNDEADPITGWARPLWWEAGPWYAAFVAQNLDWHQRLEVEQAGVQLTLVSNDDSFLGRWDQRTTHTLFRQQPSAPGFLIVRKPVLSVTELLGQLRGTLVASALPSELHDHAGVIATRDAQSAAILLYNKTDMSILADGPSEAEAAPLEARQSVRVTVRISGVPSGPLRLTELRIDNDHGNPYGVWKKLGRPTVLDAQQAAALAAAQDPARVRLETVAPEDGRLVFSVLLPAPSVSLLLLEQAAGP